MSVLKVKGKLQIGCKHYTIHMNLYFFFCLPASFWRIFSNSFHIFLSGVYPDLLATSGDYLRVWRAGEPETRLECLLNNNKNSDFCAPLTSFDWNEVDPNLLGTSSIDTTCTIWGLETGQTIGRVSMVSGQVKTQLIAHDKEVYDIAFR